MTTDPKKAARALEMIKTELGGRPTVNTLQTFLLIAEHECGALRAGLERLLKASSGTVSRAIAFWTDETLIVRQHVLRDLRTSGVNGITYEGRASSGG